MYGAKKKMKSAAKPAAKSAGKNAFQKMAKGAGVQLTEDKRNKAGGGKGGGPRR